MAGFLYLGFILVVALAAALKARRPGNPGPLLVLLLASAGAVYLFI